MLDTRPIWDNFEVLFFLSSGVFVGFILGYLFPSLWRTFRRAFFKNFQFLSQPLVKNKNFLNPEWLSPDENNHEKNHLFSLKFYDQMNSARYYFQNSLFRKSAEIYIHLLKNKNISSHDTQRVFYELSMVYVQLGIHSYAFETAFELLCRYRLNSFYFNYILDVLELEPTELKMNQCLENYKGFLSKDICKKISSLYLSLGKMEDNQKTKLNLIQSALKWFPSEGEALELLWDMNFFKNLEDSCAHPDLFLPFLPEALSFLMKLQKEVDCSSVLVGTKLYEIIKLFIKNNQLLKEFQKQKKYIFQKFSLQEPSTDLKNSYKESIFYAIILLGKKNELADNQDFCDFIDALSYESGYFQKCQVQLDKISKEFLPEALSFHKCGFCGNIQQKFTWKCPSCHMRNACLPTFHFNTF